MPYIILLIKVLFMCVLGIAIRGTLPRYRFDQFTQLNWKHLVFVWLAFLSLNIVYSLVLI